MISPLVTTIARTPGLSQAEPAAVLREGLQALGLALSDGQTAHLLAYLGMIAKWNQVYNLTAVRDPVDMMSHHVLDSLSVVAPLQRQIARLASQRTAEQAAQRLRLLDVGSGAGLPGVVIAIACPDLDVVCVDTVGKKAAFIQQVAVSLRLPNLRGLHARVETIGATDCAAGHREPGAFDVICSRAFSSLIDFTQWSAQALAPGGCWMAMKGKPPEAELAAMPAHVDVFDQELLQVPGLDAERCLVWMRPQQQPEIDAHTTDA
jgi:16S rRNA (guanine527-N7)-methyltransferase